MKVNAIIQARCGSTRFPNKVFIDIEGHPLIWHVVERLKLTKYIDDIIVATTTNTRDNRIENWCRTNHLKCFRGSEDDVLNRYYETSVFFPSDVVVRVTADDPFKEPSVIDLVIKKLTEEKLDLVTNNYPPTFPEGLDCEAFTFETLETMENDSIDPFEREHVTQYAYRNPAIFKIGNIESEKNLSMYRWTIDSKEDYDMVKAIYSYRKGESEGLMFMDEILDILVDHPDIAMINSTVKRSAMFR